MSNAGRNPNDKMPSGKPIEPGKANSASQSDADTENQAHTAAIDDGKFDRDSAEGEDVDVPDQKR